MKAITSLTASHSTIISVMVALACGFYALFLGQDINWDLQNYHLYNPYAFLNDRMMFDLAPAGLQTWFSPLLDIAYFFAISNLSPKTVGFLLGFVQGLNFFLVYKIALVILSGHARKHLYALLLALAGILSVGFVAEIGSTMQDSTVALFPLLSLWIILQTTGQMNDVNQRQVYRLLALAGFISGIGIGLKLVTAIYALALCLSLLVISVNWSKRLKYATLFGIAVLAGMLLSGGYWLIEMWNLYGNPIFPQFNHVFQSEMAPAEAIRDIRFLPKSLFEKVFYPVIFTIDPQRVAELGYKQYSWLVIYIGVFALLGKRFSGIFLKRPDQRLWSQQASYLMTFFIISYLLWLNLFGIYRYLVTIDLIIPLLLYLIITVVLSVRWREVFALAFIFTLTAVNLPGAPDWWHNPWSDKLYHVEPNALTTGPEPAVIFLAGQPAAWIIPAMDIHTPFIQIMPNFPINEAYWQRAKEIVAGRSGLHFLVYGPNAEHEAQRVEHGMMKLDIVIEEKTCDKITAYLGAGKFEYRFCEVRTIQ